MKNADINLGPSIVPSEELVTPVSSSCGGEMNFFYCVIVSSACAASCFFIFFIFAYTPSSGGFINETGSSDWLTHHLQIIMKQHFSTASTAAAAPKRITAQYNVSSRSAFAFFLLPSLPLNLSKSPSTLGHWRPNGCHPVNSAVVLGKPTIMSARSEAIVLPWLHMAKRKSRGRVKTAHELNCEEPCLFSAAT